MRLALGAGAAHLLRSLLVEGLILSAALGSALEAIAAVAGVSVLRGWAATLLPRLDEVRLDSPSSASRSPSRCWWRWRARWRRRSMRSGAGWARWFARVNGLRGSGGRVTGALVTAQIAIPVPALVAGALLGRTVGRLLAIDAGIEPHHAFTMS